MSLRRLGQTLLISSTQSNGILLVWLRSISSRGNMIGKASAFLRWHILLPLPSELYYRSRLETLVGSKYLGNSLAGVPTVGILSRPTTLRRVWLPENTTVHSCPKKASIILSRVVFSVQIIVPVLVWLRESFVLISWQRLLQIVTEFKLSVGR
jgi:hypothetical protein